MRKALEASFIKDECEVVPYKLLGEPLTAVQAVARQRLELFNSIHESN